MDEDTGFDPQAFINREDVPATDTPPEQPPAQPQALPTVTPKLSTFYFPATPEETRAAGLSYGMEGGTHGGGRFGDVHLPDHTLEQYLSGKSPFVAVAMKGEPTGDEFMTTILGHTVLAKNVDTGGGLKDGQIDFATSNPELARTGIQHGPFDPQSFIKREDVPDIHQFMEPAPAEPEAAPTPDENPYAAVGKAISKGASAVGAAMSRPAPQLNFGSHEIRQAFGQPIEAAQVNAMVGNTAPAIPMPTPSPMPTPQYQPQQAAPVLQGTMEGLQQTAAGLVPHTMEQFRSLATLMRAPTHPDEFFNLALQQGLVTAKIAQDAIKAGPLSKEAGLAYGTIIPQALMAYGGLSAAGAAPSAATIGRSLIGQNILPRARESGAIGAAGAPQGISGQAAITSTREVPVPESLQPHERPDFERGSIHINVRGNEIDPSRPLSGWVLPAELGDNPNTMSTRYGRAGLTAVYVPKEFVQRSKTRPARIKEGYIPPPENVAVIPPEAVRPSGTIDWSKVFKRDQPPAPPTGGSGTVPWNGQGTPPQPPAPPVAPPPAAPKPSYSNTLNPVRDHGPFTRTYKIDKELGEMTDAVGAAKEAGNIVSEIAHRNMTFELSPQQEADVGKLLLSDRLRSVNPHHPQVIFDSVARGIEADPASKKALDYYRKEIEPDAEALHKRAGTSEASIAPGRGKYVPLIPEALPDGTIPELAAPGRLSMTTKFSKPAEGMAAKYSSNLRDILRATYTEPMRKAAMRDLLEASHAKGVLEKSSQFVPDPAQGPNAGKWVKTLDQGNLPEQMKHDLQLIKNQMSTVRPVGIERVLKSYQRGATAIQLGLNPLEMFNHMRRGLGIAAAKPPIGQGLMARMEAVVPYFGAKIGTLKRAMGDMSLPERVEILKEIISQGGGGSRAFREQYGTNIPGLKQANQFTNDILFSIPKGKGIKGFDLRLRVIMEEIRRAAEPNLAKDKQRMRQFANQLGQYGSMKSWPVQALSKINPYAATTLPMRWAELKTLIGSSGLKSSSVPQSVMRRAETLLRGTGGTAAMLVIANKLLSGKYPWENDPKHLFDLATGVFDKAGQMIYIPNRFLSPEIWRAISSMSIPDMVRELRGDTSDAMSKFSAAGTGPLNTALALINSPALGIASSVFGFAPHVFHDPGAKGYDPMRVGQYTRKDAERGTPPLLKRAEGVAEQLHPLLSSILGYMDEPIKGLKPLGIFSVDSGGSSSGGSSYGRSSGRGSGGRGSGRGRGGR